MIFIGTNVDDTDWTLAASFVSGRRGNDILNTTTTDHAIMYGGPGDDLLSYNNGTGDGFLFGGRGADNLFGGIGADFIRGQKGADTLFGNKGRDTLRGDRGNDRLFGEEGNDTLKGGSGADRLVGGDGADTLRGGKGSDTFAFYFDPGVDRIKDFVSGVDTIAIGSVAGTVLTSDQFHLGTLPDANEQRAIYDTATGRLFWDEDGSGAAEQVLLARLAPSTLLTHTDIIAG